MAVEIIQQFLVHLPDSPGVYRMLGEEGEPLYIGKAKSLRKRVQAYTAPEKHPYRLKRMIFQTAKMEFITTRTEAEALLLEAQLIRKLKPRYNILLKDDKSFPYITVSMGHAFPRIAKHRGAKNPADLYFGPFASGSDVEQNLRFLQRTFLVRPCKDSFFEGRKRPCLEYQIKRCSAPCVDKISQAAYREQVNELVSFMKGQRHEVKERLAAEMEKASIAMEYERAGELRDRIKSLAQMQSKQSFRVEHLGDTDIIALYRESEGGPVACDLFTIRGGQACGNRAFYPKGTEDSSDGEVIEQFLAQLYQVNPPPAQILLNCRPMEPEVLQEALSELKGAKVVLEVPQRGEKAELVAQIAANAKAALEKKRQEEIRNETMLKEVAKICGVEGALTRIEIYDNSHISGKMPVGAMVVAGAEGFLKAEYRHYKLDESDGALATGGDDFAFMRYVFTKRFEKLQKEKNPEKWPQLMLIDGGAQHLATVQEVYNRLGVSGIKLVAIAKGPERNAGKEEFFIPGQPSFRLPQGSPALHYLQRLRDEAHRFAITAHRKRRSKAISTSQLDAIPGIGARRKKALLLHFGSIEAIRDATLAELAQAPGINRKTAEEIKLHFRAN